MLLNSRLLSRAYRSIPVTTTIRRSLGGSQINRKEKTAKGIGSTSKDHIARTDDHNVQADASNAGKAAKESGGKDDATSERDTHNSNEKAKKDHPEAPSPVVGMNDERGGVRS